MLHPKRPPPNQLQFESLTNAVYMKTKLRSITVMTVLTPVLRGPFLKARRLSVLFSESITNSQSATVKVINSETNALPLAPNIRKFQ